MYTYIRGILLTVLFSYGCFFCKTSLDQRVETEFKKNYFDTKANKIITRLILLNKKIAISQYYQFQMIAYFTRFNVPMGHHHHHKGVHHQEDCLTDYKNKIIKEYMLSHIEEFFDLNRYYRLMQLSLEFDTDNDMVREFGIHLSYTSKMMRMCVDVLKHTYKVEPSWVTAFNIGWLYFYVFKENDSARFWLKRAMSFHGAPKRIANCYAASFFLDKKYDEAILSTKEKLLSTTSQQMKNILEKRLKWFEAFALLAKKTVEYKKIYKKELSSLKDLIDSGLLKQIPKDYIGDGFYWDIEKHEPESKNSPYRTLDKKILQD